MIIPEPLASSSWLYVCPQNSAVAVYLLYTDTMEGITSSAISETSETVCVVSEDLVNVACTELKELEDSSLVVSAEELSEEFSSACAIFSVASVPEDSLPFTRLWKE